MITVAYETEREDVYSAEDLEEESYPEETANGKQRVMRLVLILLVLLLLAGVFFFGILPLIQSFTQAPIPDLAPAIQI